MSPRRRALLVLAATAPLLALAPAARAMGGQDCAPEDLAPVDAWLAANEGHGDEATPPTLAASACVVSPVDKGVLIVAAAYDRGTAYAKDFIAALVDRRAARVRSVFKGAIDEDASMSVLQGSLRIDTARYDLAAGVRAFGVDVSSGKSGPRCAEASFGAGRTLFVPDGTSLRPVLSSVLLESWQLVSGNICPSIGDDSDAVMEHTATTISLSPHASHGFADLVLTTIRDSVPQRRTSVVLRYNGSTYGSNNWHPWFSSLVAPQRTPR